MGASKLMNASPRVTIMSPATSSAPVDPNTLLSIQLQSSGAYPAKKVDVYLNGKYILTNDRSPLNFSFIPADVGILSGKNTLSVTLYDSIYNKGQTQIDFMVQ